MAISGSLHPPADSLSSHRPAVLQSPCAHPSHITKRIQPLPRRAASPAAARSQSLRDPHRSPRLRVLLGGALGGRSAYPFGGMGGSGRRGWGEEPGGTVGSGARGSRPRPLRTAILGGGAGCGAAGGWVEGWSGGGGGGGVGGAGGGGRGGAVGPGHGVTYKGCMHVGWVERQ